MQFVSSPYASIILPTHDRSRTLPFAVNSILAQSVKEIELILVGDGCTPEVKEVCRSFEQMDSRVKFMDLPKAPLRGGANRDLGVRSATADRIFYCDDDDLFLRDHVKILGKELDHCDVVDTPAASACPEGHVELGLLNSESQMLKDFLLNEKFKGVFDTHLAHRKTAYLDNASAWLNAKDDRIVLHMLKSFASDSRLRWMTINKITALSLHGIRRLTMSDEDREDELRKWLRRIERPNIATDILRNGRFSSHLMRLLWTLKNNTSAIGNDLLKSIGLEWNENRIWNFSRVGDYHEINEMQSDSIQGCIDLSCGVRNDLEQAAILFEELLDPLLGPWFPCEHVIRLHLRLYTPDELREIIGLCRNRPAVWLARALFSISQDCADRSELNIVAERFEDFPLYNRFAAGWAIVQALQSREMTVLAWEWSCRIEFLAPYSKHATAYWKSRETLANKLDRNKDELFAKNMALDLEILLK